jgi:hypothetical protein
VTPARLELSGPLVVGDLPLDATFRHGFAPGGTDPARVAARLSLTPETLALLGAALPAGIGDGRGGGVELDLSFAPDGATAFRLTSDLVGAAVSVAPLGWSKAAGDARALEVEGVVTDGRTRIDRMSLAAPGLSATGRIEPGEGPGTGSSGSTGCRRGRGSTRR